MERRAKAPCRSPMAARTSVSSIAWWEGTAIPEDILERARRIAEQAEVFHIRRVETPVHFEANRLKSIERRETVGAAVRIIKDGRIGFGSSTALHDPGEVVRSALETAPFGAEARFDFPGPAQYPDVPVYDAAVGETPLEEMVQLGQRVVDAVRAFSEEVQVEGTVSRSESTVTMMNSRGGQFQYTKTTAGLGFEGTVIRGEDMLFVFDFESSCHPIADPSSVADSIVRQLEMAQRTAIVQSGPMPVIFMPTAVSSVLLAPTVTDRSIHR